MEFSCLIYWIPVSIVFCFVFDGSIFIAELFLTIIGFHFFIHILSFLSCDIVDKISNFVLVILFSILSGCIPFSVKSFLFCIILYSFVLSMIFSNLVYCVLSSTFSGFVDIIFISFFIFVITLLFGLAFIISI